MLTVTAVNVRNKMFSDLQTFIKLRIGSAYGSAFQNGNSDPDRHKTMPVYNIFDVKSLVILSLSPKSFLSFLNDT
jgi:hypothetical protein